MAEAVQENRRKRGRRRKATPAQMRARAEFARRARSGEFRGGRKSKKRRRELAQNRKMKKRRGRRAEENRRHAKYQENRGRRYAENRGRRQEESQEEQQMAASAQLDQNPRKKSKKRRAKRKKRGGRKAKARRRSPKRRRSRGRRSRVVKTHVVTLPRSQVQVMERKRPRRRKKTARKGRKRGRRRSKREMMLQENPGLFSGAGPIALYENQGSPFTMASIRAYGVAAVGVGIGLIVADVTDRLIATRTPKDGKNPLYGKDAAGAIRMRPDAWRLGGQAGGAALGMGLAWWTRGRGIVPWLLGGVAVGFGSNLVKQVWDWYIAPAVMKVELADAGKPSAGNRVYSLEQNYIQDQVAKLFATRPFVTTLAPGQNDPPQITSPLGGGGTGDSPMMQLAGARGQVGRPGQSARTMVRTGRVGTCAECGCSDGCYSDCPTLCPNCPEFNQNTMCRHQVGPNDDISAFASAGGVTVAQIEAINPPGAWTPGNVVFLPYGVCSAMQKGTFTPAVTSTTPAAPTGPMIEEPPGGPVPPPAALPVPGVTYGVAGVPDDDYLKRSMIFMGANRQ